MLSASPIIRYNILQHTNGYTYGYGGDSRSSFFWFADPSSKRSDSVVDIIICRSRSRSSDSNGRSPNKETKGKPKGSGNGNGNGKGAASRLRSSTSQLSGSVYSKAPGINSRIGGPSSSITSDLQFEERLQAITRSALDQKKAEEKKQYGPIDYDAPTASELSGAGLGTKIGVGVAVVVFGLVFALGDFLPSGSVNPKKDDTLVKNAVPPEEKAKLEATLQQYEATLDVSPKDPVALEGAAVTLTELGDYARAASMLEDLIKEKPSDPEAFRLLGEVKYELKDYEGSVAAYRSSAMTSKKTDFEVLRGLTNALLAAKKPDEAVQILQSSRDSLGEGKTIQANIGSNGSATDTNSQLDPIQVDLLLGKAYSDWGHVSDAVAVYDQLISSHPNEFRGYLAKGIILKRNGKLGDAERMFIQARFLAPEGAKAIVDRYSRE